MSIQNAPIGGKPLYRIVDQDCIRCAACSSIAPAIFFVDEDEGARVLRQPETDDEVEAAETAVANCPTAAIERSEHS